MKLTVLISAGALAASLPLAALAQSATNLQSATTIMVGGQVYTPSGWSTAVAFRDGRIVAVGSDAQVRAKAAPCSPGCTTCICIR